MKKDTIFFTADGKGLTSTSANHIANLAKEMIRNILTSLDEMTFYSTNVSLISGNKPHTLNQGITDTDVMTVIDKLHEVSAAKSLIAWLREAIKARERLLDETRDLSLEQFAEIEGIELKERPQQEKIMTEDEYFASRPLDERCRYYELETLASTLGKAIHPGGSFAEARTDLQAKVSKPHSVEDDGRDTEIYTYAPTVDESVVEDVYFNIQKQYREAQSRLNSMKHECLKAIEESTVAATGKYSKDLAEWTNQRTLLEARRMEYIERRAKELNALRIIIPQSLTDIYEKVSDLHKNKA